MGTPRKKVVQTEVDEKTYSGLVQAAERRGLTIKEALREAVSEWAGRYIDLSNDPFFNLRPFKNFRTFPSEEMDEHIYEEKWE